MEKHSTERKAQSRSALPTNVFKKQNTALTIKDDKDEKFDMNTMF
jgi:hypothetical protein